MYAYQSLSKVIKDDQNSITYIPTRSISDTSISDYVVSSNMYEFIYGLNFLYSVAPGIVLENNLYFTVN